MSRPAKIIIDLSAIQANCRLAQTLAPYSKTVAVIKADAYGHGAVEVAKALESQVEMFTVSCLEEALILRENGLSKPILLLEGCFEQTELKVALNNQCEIVVHSSLQLEQLLNTPLETSINVWLKVDTGMHRLGITPQEVESVYAKLNASANVKNIILMNSGVIIIFSNNEKEINDLDKENLLSINTNKVCFVNNASTDNTLNLLNNIKFTSDNNISILDIKHDKGVKSALKSGARLLLSESEFDFIVYLQSNMLEYLEVLKGCLINFEEKKQDYNSLPTRSKRNVLNNVFSIDELLKNDFTN